MVDNIKSVLRIIEHLQFILTGKQKRDSIVVFFSMIVGSLLELIGVSIIYPFLQLMLDEEVAGDKFYIIWLKTIYPEIDRTQILVILGIVVAFVYLLKNSVSLICTYIQARYSSRINKELSVRMLDSYMKRPYEYFINTHSSIIMRGMSGDVNSVYSIILCIFQIFAECFSVFLIVIYLFSVDKYITLASVLISLLCFLAITIGLKSTMKRLGKQLRELQAKSSGFLYQAINGIKEITVLDRRGRFVDEYEVMSGRIAKKKITDGVVSAAPDRVLEAGCIAGVMGVLCIRIASGVEIDTFVPTLGAFVMGFFRIMPSVARISGRVNGIVYHMPGLNNTYDILKDDEAYTRNRMEEEKELASQLKRSGIKEIRFENYLIIDSVFWKYKDSDDFVLKGLSMIVHKGESIALIGTSGGGKSTLVDMLMALFEPQKGSIKADGINIFLMQDEWRKKIGYVPQSIFLTADSIRSNVAFGIPESDIDDDRVWDALDKAQLKEFVASLPNRLDTLVGERGVKISGGQRQRIAIARALYDQPEILILDEATAALDNETEKAFMEAIDALQGEKTIILVAHRLTTIRNCDRVYEIKDGIATEREVSEVLANV